MNTFVKSGLFVVILALFSCNDSPVPKRSLGGINEILVALDSEDQWKGSLGDSIRSYFGQFLPGLPMPEESFSPFFVLTKKLYSDDFHKPHHNILIVEFDSNLEKASVESRKNLWASPQQVIRFSCPSDTSFFRLFRQYYPSLFKLYRETEKTRVINLFSGNPSKSIMQKLNQQYGLDMLIPGGFSVAAENDSFIWIRQSVHRKKQDTELGFFLYFRPYRDTLSFSHLRVIHDRDSVTQKYIPGPSEGSYMTTSTDVIPPEFNRTRNFSTGFALETRGLWKVENDFMGGPFLSYTFVDTRRNVLITAEGYLYNPNNEQRKYMIQIEALLNTIKLYEGESSSSVPVK